MMALNILICLIYPPVDVYERDTILRHHAVILSRARDLEVQFLSSILSNNNVSENGGYPTKEARDQWGGRRASVIADRRHHFIEQSPLPPQYVSFTVIDNKVQLIDAICVNLPAHFQDHLCNNKLIITGPNTIPDEITMGVHVKRHDMGNSHKEADVNQVMSAASQGYQTIHTACDNTDGFVLLVHFHKTLNITGELLMVPTTSTTRKHDKLLPHILLLHYSANRQEVFKSWHNVVIVGNNVVINILSW